MNKNFTKSDKEEIWKIAGDVYESPQLTTSSIPGTTVDFIPLKRRNSILIFMILQAYQISISYIIILKIKQILNLLLIPNWYLLKLSS